MTPEQREQLRLSILRVLAANVTPYGTPLTFLRSLLIAEGRPWLTRQDVEAEMLYLRDAGLVATVDKPVSPENTAWRVTKEGRDFLALRGLD